MRRPVGLVFFDDFGAGDVGGHQVGRELDAVEAQAERLGQRGDQQRLGQSRHADQQAWPSAEERDEQFFDDRFLADDDFAQLGAHIVIGALELLDRGHFVCGQVGRLRLNQANLFAHVSPAVKTRRDRDLSVQCDHKV